MPRPGPGRCRRHPSAAFAARTQRATDADEEDDEAQAARVDRQGKSARTAMLHRSMHPPCASARDAANTGITMFRSSCRRRTRQYPGHGRQRHLRHASGCPRDKCRPRTIRRNRWRRLPACTDLRRLSALNSRSGLRLRVGGRDRGEDRHRRHRQHAEHGDEGERPAPTHRLAKPAGQRHADDRRHRQA